MNLLDSNVRVVAPDEFINLINENLNNNQLNDDVIHLSYPNPTRDKFIMELRISIEEIENAILFDIDNNKILDNYSILSNTENFSKIEFDLSSTKPVVYLLKINTKNKSIVKKIILQ